MRYLVLDDRHLVALLLARALRLHREDMRTGMGMCARMCAQRLSHNTLTSRTEHIAMFGAVHTRYPYLLLPQLHQQELNPLAEALLRRPPLLQLRKVQPLGRPAVRLQGRALVK